MQPGVDVGSGSTEIAGSTLSHNQDGAVVAEGGSATIQDSTLSDNVDMGAFVTAYSASLTLHPA